MPKVTIPTLTLTDKTMVARKPLAISAVAGLAVMASPVPLPQAVAQRASHPLSAASTSEPALSALDAERMTHRVIDYVVGSRVRDDISLERLQSAAEVRLRWLNQQAGYDSPELPGGGWATLLYWEDSAISGRTVALQYSSDDAENDPPVKCHLSLENVRRRSIANGFSESRDLGELGEVVVWIFHNSQIRIEVNTRFAQLNGQSVDCVRSIKAIG